MTYFSIWRRGPLGRRINRPTWQVPGRQTAYSPHPGQWSRVGIYTALCVWPIALVVYAQSFVFVCYAQWTSMSKVAEFRKSSRDIFPELTGLMFNEPNMKYKINAECPASFFAFKQTVCSKHRTDNVNLSATLLISYNILVTKVYVHHNQVSRTMIQKEVQKKVHYQPLDL